MVVAAISFTECRAFAQDPPPPLPRVVVDLHGVIPVFPNDAEQLASSRGMKVAELPGAGYGARAGAHVYFLKIKAMTFGAGGEAMLGASSSTPAEGTGLLPVDERLKTASGQLSVNFGSGHGWSYLSGGMGRSLWSLHAAGSSLTNADTEALPTVNYGGGARWFAKKHLAFSVDVRLYEIQPGSPIAERPGSPRTRLLVVSAGISLK